MGIDYFLILNYYDIVNLPSVLLHRWYQIHPRQINQMLHVSHAFVPL